MFTPIERRRRAALAMISRRKSHNSASAAKEMGRCPRVYAYIKNTDEWRQLRDRIHGDLLVYAIEMWCRACYIDGDSALARKICWTFDLLGQRQESEG